MVRFHANRCEDEEDAARLSAAVLRELGYMQLALNANSHLVNEELTEAQLRNIALYSERISRWARNELKNSR